MITYRMQLRENRKKQEKVSRVALPQFSKQRSFYCAFLSKCFGCSHGGHKTLSSPAEAVQQDGYVRDDWQFRPLAKEGVPSLLLHQRRWHLAESGYHLLCSQHGLQVPLNGTNDTVPCTQWEYDTSYFSQTIVSEWDLVCSREWLVSLAKSIYMVGFLISVIFFGQLSDSVGRFTAVAIAYVITVVSMLLALLSTSYTMFLILRFLQAFGRTGLTTVGFVLVMELVGPQHRTETGIAIQIGWALGFASLAAVAWLFRHWFWFQVALSVPILPLALAYRILPESPRWLLMKGKMVELEKILRHAAEVNGREIKGDLRDLLVVDDKGEEEKQKTRTLLDVLRLPKMRNRTFNMIYLWVVNSFMYYGLSFNTNDLAGNPYLNFFVAGALEFPSYALLFWGIKKWGRRPTLVTLMLVGGAACVAIVPVPSDLPWLSTSFAMAGKFCVTGSFGLLYLYTSELFPTVVRNVTLGSCSMCARVGSILAPFVRELGKATHPAVPNVLYGLLALTSGLLALLLPETRGENMPDSLEDGENFGR
ncbi:organic cation transporter protein [Trichonephila clavata]|uniref:Organic cation transporter protein n=1 Tax=Trichonephila clavata TaxID=2740835 RepID=A0A8X6EZM3_TRICU|nr:organic cation transporter protein [Trichonephila clavata]